MHVGGSVLGILALAAAVLLSVAHQPAASLRQDQAGLLPADRDTQLVYVALGDSTVEGVGATSSERNYVSLLHLWLRDLYPAAEVANLGVGGATSADVLRDQVPTAIVLRPHLSTLSVGPNDLTRGVPVELFEANVSAIFEALTQDTRAAVVVNLLPEIALAPAIPEAQKSLVAARTIQFNEALEGAARQYNVEVVDLYSRTQAEGLSPELLSADQYHPSDAGYALWAEMLWGGIEARIPLAPASR